MNVVVHKYLMGVRKVQRNIRDFIACKHAKINTLSILWTRLERNYVKHMVEKRKVSDLFLLLCFVELYLFLRLCYECCAVSLAICSHCKDIVLTALNYVYFTSSPSSFNLPSLLPFLLLSFSLFFSFLTAAEAHDGQDEDDRQRVCGHGPADAH